MYLSGGKNQRLMNELGVNKDNVSFEHPRNDVTRPVFFIYDPTHLLKSARNNFLDNEVTLPEGSTVTKKDFYDLIEKTNSEITTAFRISEEHLEVEGSDRQDVSKALQIFSEEIAANFLTYFPRQKNKKALAEFIQVIAKAYKNFSSRYIYFFKDKFKSAFRAYLEEQMEVLEQLQFNMENTKFGPNRFSDGFVLTSRAVIQLHKLMKDQFDCPFLMTSHICQDYVESKFSVYRAMDGKGGNRVPTGLELGHRIQRDTVHQFLKDPDVDIFSLRDELEAELPKPTEYQGNAK